MGPILWTSQYFPTLRLRDCMRSGLQSCSTSALVRSPWGTTITGRIAMTVAVFRPANQIVQVHHGAGSACRDSSPYRQHRDGFASPLCLNTAHPEGPHRDLRPAGMDKARSVPSVVLGAKQRVLRARHAQPQSSNPCCGAFSFFFFFFLNLSCSLPYF